MGVEDTQFSRTCPSCGRRVPRKVATCRCGAELPPDTGYDAPAETDSPGSSRAAVLISAIVVIGAAGFGAFWFTRPVTPASSGAQSAASEAPGTTASPATEPAAPANDANSAARRAWDLAANLKTAEKAPITRAPIETPAPSATQGSIEEIVSRSMPAIVRIETPSGTGSGFYVRPDTVVTNRHVVTDNTEVTLRRGDGSSIRARVDQTGSDVDVAILRVAPSPGQVLIPMGSPSSLRLGQEIILIGSPFGVLQNSVSRGIVSAMRESEGVQLVQTDAAANPGNSGGPMLDRYGSAVGILTMGFKGSQGLNFAVSIDHARSMIEGRGTSVKAAPSYGTPRDPSRPSFTEPTPAGGEGDRAREAAQQQYERVLEALAREADRFDPIFRDFKAQCYGGSISGFFDHEWFALLDSRAMPGQVQSQCMSYFGSMKKDAQRFKAAMNQAEEAGRRGGVYPGVMREARRNRKLDFDWDR